MYARAQPQQDGFSPFHPLKVGTEAHTNRQKEGTKNNRAGREAHEQTQLWRQKHKQTNRVGTKAHTNKTKK